MLTIDCKGAVEKMFTKTSSDATLNGFHIRVVVSVGIAWATLSLGIMLAGFVVPLAFTQGITNLSLSVYMIAGLGSLYIGMPLSTKFATLVGEKNTILIGLGIVGLASIISIIFDDFWTLTIVRFLGGFGLSFLLVIAPEYVTEFLPLPSRAKAMYGFDLFWPAGYFLGCAGGIGILFLGGSNSALLFFMCGLLALISLGIVATLPSTPARFVKQYQTSGDLTADLIEINRPVRVSISRSRSSAKQLAILSWVLMNILYYAIFLWAPTLLFQAFVSNSILFALGLLLFGGVQLPSQLLANQVMERAIPFKLFLVSVTTSVCALVIILACYNSGFSIIGWIALAVATMWAWAALYPLTDLLSQTDNSISENAQRWGKLSAVFGPLLVALVWDWSSSPIIALFSVAIVLVILLALIFWIVMRDANSEFPA